MGGSVNEGHVELAANACRLFLLSHPVPNPIYEAVPPEYRLKGTNSNDEFSKLRYTAITVDANEFGKSSSEFNLRQNIYGRANDTEMVICVTSYNEGPNLYAKTLHGVFKNIRDIVNMSRYVEGEAISHEVADRSNAVLTLQLEILVAVR